MRDLRTAYRFLAAFFAVLAAGFFAAAFFAVFLAMAYTPFPGGVLWPAARRNCVRSQRCLSRSRPVSGE